METFRNDGQRGRSVEKRFYITYTKTGVFSTSNNCSFCDYGSYRLFGLGYFLRLQCCPSLLFMDDLHQLFLVQSALWYCDSYVLLLQQFHKEAYVII